MHVHVVESVLKLNDDVAKHNRDVLRGAGVFTIDLIGGPGCGKTTLVEKTVAALRKDMRIGVIVGDLTTARDAQRIAAVCPEVVQINTGKGCHLEAHQVRQAMEKYRACSGPIGDPIKLNTKLPKGEVYLVGNTSSGDFPVTEALAELPTIE